MAGLFLYPLLGSWHFADWSFTSQLLLTDSLYTFLSRGLARHCLALMRLEFCR